METLKCCILKARQDAYFVKTVCDADQRGKVAIHRPLV